MESASPVPGFDERGALLAALGAEGAVLDELAGYLEFIESPLFSKYLSDYLADDEYLALQEYLCEHPEAGDLIRGSGGVRKLRWGRQGSGKSGGRAGLLLRPHQGRADADAGDLCQERKGRHTRPRAQGNQGGNGTWRR